MIAESEKMVKKLAVSVHLIILSYMIFNLMLFLPLFVLFLAKERKTDIFALYFLT